MCTPSADKCIDVLLLVENRFALIFLLKTVELMSVAGFRAHTYIHSVIRVLNNVNNLIYVSVPPAAAGEGTAVAAGAEHGKQHII